MTVITSAFTRLAQVRGVHLGMPAHPVVVVPHPLASMIHDDVVDMARGTVEDVGNALSS